MLCEFVCFFLFTCFHIVHYVFAVMPKKFTKFTVHKVISTATSKTLVAASATSDECVFCAT